MSSQILSQSELAIADKSDTVLELENLHTRFFAREGVAHAVDGVSYSIARGETLGVVGESGCGKSVTALSILRLVPDPPGRIVQGAIRFQGKDLLKLTENEMQAIRGNDISMIFQEPMTSLNPVLTIGDQISEVIMLHQGLSKRLARKRTVEMLRLVHIPEAERLLHDYPHELSGGMRQRVMIAMALSCNPQILIADEPTTALDVTIQAQILALMRELQDKLGTAILLITHDMGLIAEHAERVVVMYAGRKIEEAPVRELFHRPSHPYTVGLLASIPRVGRAPAAAVAKTQKNTAGQRRHRLNEIEGIVPSLYELPPGCTFAPRCSYASEQCRQQFPPLEQLSPGHWAACWHTQQVRSTGP